MGNVIKESFDGQGCKTKVCWLVGLQNKAGLGRKGCKTSGAPLKK